MKHSRGKEGKAAESIEEAEEFDIQNSLAFRMVKLVNVLNREFQREFEEELDLALPEWRVLAVLYQEPDLSSAEIARRTGHNPLVISRAVKRLSNMGRIKRRVHRVDGRRQCLSLTKSGEEVFRRISPLAMRWERALVDCMLPKDIVALSAVIDRTIERLGD